MSTRHRIFGAALLLIVLAAFFTAASTPSGSGYELYAQGNATASGGVAATFQKADIGGEASFTDGTRTFRIGDEEARYYCGSQDAGDITAYEFLDGSGHILIFDGTGTMADYSTSSPAPWTVQDQIVEAVLVGDGIETIGRMAFASCSTLETVDFGSGIVSIRDNAFQGCASLDGIVFPTTLDRIYEGAFRDCTSLSGIEFPENTRLVERAAFSGCTGLVSVIFGTEKMGQITYSVFDGCSSLSELTLPEGIASIGSDAFRGCASLESLTVPESVTRINESAFEGCLKLTKISILGADVDVSGKAFYVGEPYSDMQLLDFELVTPDESLIIPGIWLASHRRPDTSSIAFLNYDRTYLTSTYCKTGTEIKVPSIVPERPADGEFSYTFCGWSPAFPEDMISTGDTSYRAVYEKQREAFDYGGYTYGMGDALGTYSIGKDSADDLKAYEFAIRGQEENGRILFLDGSGDMEDMENGRKVPWKASVDEIRELVVADDRITSIGSDAFDGCGSLEKVVLGNGIKKIGDFAFCDTALQEIDIPESVEEIGIQAFSYCDSLKDVIIPGNVARMSHNVFFSCISLERAVFQAGSLTSVPPGTFNRCTALTDVTLADGISEIGGGAFRDCALLSRIEFPEGMDRIENGAFTSCISLEQVAFPASLRIIGTAAFEGCTKLESITIPSGVEEVRERAFLNCTSLTDIHAEGEGTQFLRNVFLVEAPYSAENLLATTLDTENQGLLNPRIWKWANRSANICTIRFVDYDGTELEMEQYVLKGKAFSVPESSPEREADAQHSYVFTGWEPQLPDSLVADSDQTFRAQYRQEARKYEVRFYDRHGELRGINAAYGQVPEDPQFPLEERDGGVAYILSGWHYVYRDADGTEQTRTVQELQPVSGAGEYYCAQYDVELLYEVSFLDWDGTEIARDFYRQGETVTTPQDPQREGSPQADYTFSGWEPQVQAQCIGEASYRASYTETAKTYTVRFLDMDGSIIKEEVFRYGDGVTPPQAPEHEGMEFTGWVQVNPEIVIGDFDMKATYREVQGGSGEDSESGASAGEGSSGSGASEGGNGSESGASAGEGGSGNGESEGGNSSDNGETSGEIGSENGETAGEGSSGNGASQGENSSESGAPDGGNSSGSGSSSGDGHSGSPAAGENKSDSGTGNGSSEGTSSSGNGSNPASGNSPSSGAGSHSSGSGGSSVGNGGSMGGNSGSSNGNSSPSSGNNSASGGNSDQSSGNNGSSSGNGNSSSGNSSLPGTGNSQSNGISTTTGGQGSQSTPPSGGNSDIANGNGKQDSGAASGSAIENSSPATKDSGDSGKNGKEQGIGEKAKDNEGKDSGTNDKGKTTDNETGGKNGSGKKQSGTGNSKGNKSKTDTGSRPGNKATTTTGKPVSEGSAASAKNISSSNSRGKSTVVAGNPESQSVASGFMTGRTTTDSSTDGRQWKLTDTLEAKAGQGKAMADASNHADRESGQDGGTAPFVTSLPADSSQAYVEPGNVDSTGGAVEDRQIPEEDKQTDAGSETGSHSIPPVFIFLGTLLAASLLLCFVLVSQTRQKRKSREEK